MIGIGEPALLSETTGALHAFNIPLVSVMPQPLPQTRPGVGSGGTSYNNILTTAPDMAGQARVRERLIIKFQLHLRFLPENL